MLGRAGVVLLALLRAVALQVDIGGDTGAGGSRMDIVGRKRCYRDREGMARCTTAQAVPAGWGCFWRLCLQGMRARLSPSRQPPHPPSHPPFPRRFPRCGAAPPGPDEVCGDRRSGPWKNTMEGPHKGGFIQICLEFSGFA